MRPHIDMVRNIPYHRGIAIRRTAMPAIHEVATLTSKGQITLPKPIRQALGVDAGGKVAFDLRDGEVIVTRADAEHEDPAIGAFLSLLARDIEARSEEHTSELQSLMRNSYAVFCLKKKKIHIEP